MPFTFIKNIFKFPKAGEKKIRPKRDWLSPSKLINCLKLPAKLKQAFFGKSYGSTFEFKGIAVKLPSTATDVLSQLRELHLKAPNRL